MTHDKKDRLPGAAVAILIASLRYRASNDRDQAHKELTDLPDDEISGAITLSLEQVEDLRMVKRIRDARHEAVALARRGTMRVIDTSGLGDEPRDELLAYVTASAGREAS